VNGVDVISADLTGCVSLPLKPPALEGAPIHARQATAGCPYPECSITPFMEGNNVVKTNGR
jgi:hypothetical protein